MNRIRLNSLKVKAFVAEHFADVLEQTPMLDYAYLFPTQYTFDFF